MGFGEGPKKKKEEKRKEGAWPAYKRPNKTTDTQCDVVCIYGRNVRLWQGVEKEARLMS